MKHRILVVDDEANVCLLTQLILEETGRFEVEIEIRSSRALTTAKAFLPDLILLDMNMPGKDGKEVAREMAAEPTLASKPVLFVTGLVGRAVEEGLVVKRDGARYLPKPLRGRELVEAVDGILAGAL